MPPLHTPAPRGPDALPVLLCLSHLRWDFVFQRPQHLLTRACRQYDVVFVEEAVRDGAAPPRMEARATPDGVTVAVPRLPEGLDGPQAEAAQRALLDAFLAETGREPSVVWYYSPMFLPVAGHLGGVVVYDCMDELSLFRGAPPRLRDLEAALFARADLVFCGGRSLHEAKRACHDSVHLFPSSIDAAHFAPARAAGGLADPEGQAGLPRPRVGYFGVIDERIDLALVEAAARLRPDWAFVMLGPLAKLSEADLPRAPNLHWLGGRRYAELPAHLAHWDAGLMPFALNEATRFISPTKTPEFLAAGVPVVSTPVADVVRDWATPGQGGATPGQEGATPLVRIAGDAQGIVAGLEAAMAEPRAPWLARVDARLALMSWDMTWAAMLAAVRGAADAAPALPSGAPSVGASSLGAPSVGAPARTAPAGGTSAGTTKDIAHA